MRQMVDAVLETAKKLCKAQNKVTTLEIKTEVMKTHKQYFWTQAFVSAVMDGAYQAGQYTYYDTMTDGNQHRVYSIVGDNKSNKTSKMTTKTPTKASSKANKIVTKRAIRGVHTVTQPTVVAPKSKTISRSKALELMENNKGHFFTATFIDKKNEERTMNCQYLKDQTYSKLGYVKVKEAIKAKMISDAVKEGKKLTKEQLNPIRNINLQTLLKLKIAGNSYKVK